MSAMISTSTMFIFLQGRGRRARVITPLGGGDYVAPLFGKCVSMSAEPPSRRIVTLMLRVRETLDIRRSVDIKQMEQ